jgi:hypothetical protein
LTRRDEMGLIIFGIIAGIVLIIVLAFWANADCKWHNLFAAFLAIVLGVGMAITIVCFCFVVWDWQAAKYKVDIINREYGAEYTREEIFFAHDVIGTIRELDRKRIEINGDIMRDEKDDK